MEKPTLDEFLQVLEKNPALCAHGMADRIQNNYQANRKSLEKSYDAFLICCDWLSQQNSIKKAEMSSRLSLKLKHEIESHCGQFIPQGTVLAAAVFLGMTLNQDFCQKSINQSAVND